MPLFEVAVLEQPQKKKKDEKPKLEKLLFGPKAVMGHDVASVGYQVLLENADKFKGKDYTLLKVIVRPFV